MMVSDTMDSFVKSTFSSQQQQGQQPRPPLSSRGSSTSSIERNHLTQRVRTPMLPVAAITGEHSISHETRTDPPFASTKDDREIEEFTTSYLARRNDKLRQHFTNVDANGNVTYDELRRALHAFDRHLVDWEIDELIRAADPSKKRGYVNLDKFIEQFGTELMKVKSLRNSPGRKNIISWEASLSDKYDKKQVMDTLREREENGHRRKYCINQTRSSIMRLEKTKKDFESTGDQERAQKMSHPNFMKIPTHLLSVSTPRGTSATASSDMYTSSAPGSPGRRRLSGGISASSGDQVSVLATSRRAN